MNSKREAFIYLGPAKPFNLPLAHNAILADEPEKVFPQLSELFKEHDDFRGLFVPVQEIGKARMKMNEPGSALAIFYNRIKLASDQFKASREN